MTRLKKLTALLVSAALALSLLAGCGGSKALSQVIADLLSGMYNNVTVEVDPDLTAALKKAAAAGSTQEEVLAALVEELNLSGVRLTLRQLQEGRQGDRGVELVFQSGADPDAAARSAVNGWASAFGALPDDGSYTARVAMIEAEGGYYIAVDVEVLKAGTPDKDEPDEPDKPTDTVVPGEGFSYNVTQNTITVESDTNGLKALFIDSIEGIDNENKDLAAARDSGFENIDIILTGGQVYTVSQQLAPTFKGTLKSADGSTKASVTLSGSAGLFGTLEGGYVENLSVNVTNKISTGTTNDAGSTCVGAVANINKGQITGCKVTISGSISSDSSSLNGSAFAGGIVGYNHGGSITGCEVTVNGSISATRDADSSDAEAGGIAGYNNGSISGCTVTLSGSGSISATGANSAGNAGGIAGCNDGTIESGCTVTLNTGSSISATGTAIASAGGITGQSNGTVNCGPASNAHAEATNPSNGTYTATVSAGAGATTATCPGNFTPGGGNVPKAAAGTTCGLRNGAPK